MRSLVVGLIVCLFTISHVWSGEDKFDSAHAIAVKGTITEGFIYSRSTSKFSVEREIKEQLYYTVGQFNGVDGVADMNRVTVSVGESEATETEGLYKVHYAAELFIAWSRDERLTETYELILPAMGNYAGLDRFVAAYGDDEDGRKRCMGWGAHDITQGIFWYYYRPEKYTCELKNATATEESVFVKFPIQLEVSKENTEGKSPEYDKVWEDGKLVVTAIFGMADHEKASNWDAGVRAYIEMYDGLLRTYGEPKENSLKGKRPNMQNNQVSLKFDTDKGEMDIVLYLVEGITLVDSEFRRAYDKRTMISDFVSYSGHSGLGANIRALARMGRFTKGQYQIFFVNGCDTFAYVDNSLRDAHHRVNPEAGPNKYFDLITNAMPSYFHMNAENNLRMIDSLVDGSRTYREILRGFDRQQRAVVTGEEDNE